MACNCRRLWSTAYVYCWTVQHGLCCEVNRSATKQNGSRLGRLILTKLAWVEVKKTGSSLPIELRGRSSGQVGILFFFFSIKMDLKIMLDDPVVC